MIAATDYFQDQCFDPRPVEEHVCPGEPEHQVTSAQQFGISVPVSRELGPEVVFFPVGLDDEPVADDEVDIPDMIDAHLGARADADRTQSHPHDRFQTRTGIYPLQDAAFSTRELGDHRDKVLPGEPPAERPGESEGRVHCRDRFVERQTPECATDCVTNWLDAEVHGLPGFCAMTDHLAWSGGSARDDRMQRRRRYGPDAVLSQCAHARQRATAARGIDHLARGFCNAEPALAQSSETSSADQGLDRGAVKTPLTQQRGGRDSASSNHRAQG